VRTIRITVIGRVQGVYFRAETKAFAKKAGIVGTVRNLDNGNVEIVATADDESLEALTAWARVGPGGATVENISCSDMPLQQFDEFSIVRD
jgi:acylphosphatase